MQNYLGRPLRRNENVHHKNGLRWDNSDGNLELWTTPQQPGQRVADLVEWVICNYKDDILKRLNNKFF